MVNKTTMKISEDARNFFYDIQSNVGVVQKKKNIKRKKINYTDALELLVKFMKLNNDTYLEYIEMVVENGSN